MTDRVLGVVGRVMFAVGIANVVVWKLEGEWSELVFGVLLTTFGAIQGWRSDG